MIVYMKMNKKVHLIMNDSQPFTIVFTSR